MITRHKLVKIETVKEVKTFKCVVVNLCPHCCAQSEDQDKAAANLAANQPVDASVAKVAGTQPTLAGDEAPRRRAVGVARQRQPESRRPVEAQLPADFGQVAAPRFRARHRAARHEKRRRSFVSAVSCRRCSPPERRGTRRIFFAPAATFRRRLAMPCSTLEAPFLR